MLGSRATLAQLQAKTWDVLVIGGGITGAGIALQTSKLNKQCLLLEQTDFAWGTSSRSSKMVHGGLRYIAQGHLRLTRDSLLERERMLQEIPDVVKRQPYHFLVRKGDFPGRLALKMVLWLYDILAGIKDHHWVSVKILLSRIEGLSDKKLTGAMYYTDALTDDSRLTLRVLHEAVADGALLANYTKVLSITPAVSGFCVVVQDQLTAQTAEIKCEKVINATGAWADKLSGCEAKVRPLRGSHIFVSREKLPIKESITFIHPKDKRPIFVYPWQGVTCVGTTDLDHTTDINVEPRCSLQEQDYLLSGITLQFPNTHITTQDVISSMAGVRPVITSGKGLNPSQESREHSVWKHQGVVSVSGGKLTTFRLIALDALFAADIIDTKTRDELRKTKQKLFNHSILFPEGLGHPTDAVAQGETLHQNLIWILSNEMVVHLDDLMLRRIRLGNVLPLGAAKLLSEIKPFCQQYLAWDDARWSQEVLRYQNIIKSYYTVG